MKTAISIPDDAFRRIEEGAARAGMNRSEFFVAAALNYVELMDVQSMVKRIDEALARSGSGTEREAHDFADAGQRALASFSEDDEQW